MKNSSDFVIIAKLLAKLGLDYVRWTQLVPMVIGWAFALIMVFGISLVVFQGSIDAMIQRAEPTIERFLGPAPETTTEEYYSDEATTIQVTDDDILPWIYRIWGGLALLGWIFSIIRTKLFGPKPSRKLRRKIGITAIACIAYTGVLILLYLAIGDFSGNTGPELMIFFVLMPFLLFIVSVWGLSISHIIDKLHLEIDKFGDDDNVETVAKTTV
jgi:hypothetical protein